MEKWKYIEGYNDKYLISSLGRVRGLQQGKDIIMSQTKDKDGYNIVKLSRGKERKTCRVHRLMMITFKPLKNMEELVIDHINTIRDDNRLENLRWCTSKQNSNNPLSIKKERQSLKGRIIPEEWKIKMRKPRPTATRGNNHKAIKIKCITTGEEFDCVLDACNKYGINNSTLCKGLKRKGIYSFKKSKDNTLEFKYL